MNRRPHLSTAGSACRVLGIVTLAAGIAGIAGHLAAIDDAPAVYTTQVLVLLGSLVVIAASVLFIGGAMLEGLARLDDAAITSTLVRSTSRDPLDDSEGAPRAEYASGPTRAQLTEVARRNRDEGSDRWTICDSCRAFVLVDATVCHECGSDLQPPD